MTGGTVHALTGRTAVLRFALPLLAAGALVLLVFGHIEQRDRLYAQEQRAMIEKEIGHHADALQRQIDRSLSVPALLAAILRQQGRIDDFEEIAAEIINSVGSVDALQLAPNGVVSKSYPLRGNEKAIGHNLFADPERREDVQRAVRTRRMIISAPVDLVQGGRAIVARLPVFTQHPGRGERFWGFVVALLRIDDSEMGGPLGRRFADNYRYELSHIAPGTGNHTPVYASSGGMLADPVIWPVRLQSGDILVLRAAPAGGWPRRPGAPLEMLLLAAAAVLLAGLTYHLVQRRVHLEKLVHVRTAELRSANADLAREVAERTRTEEALSRSEAFLDSVVENLPSMVFVKDCVELRFVRVNRAGEELLGRTRDQLLGKTNYDCFPREQADFFTARDREVLETGALVDIECEAIDTVQRGRRWLHTRKIPIRGADGRPLYLLGISQDITEHKAAMAKLAGVSRLYAVISRTSEIIVRTDDETTLLREVCRTLVETGEFACARIVLDDAAGIVTAFASHGADMDAGAGEAATFPLKVELGHAGVLTLLAHEATPLDNQQRELLRRLADDLSYALQALRQEARGREDRHRLRLAGNVFEHSAEGIVITDPECRILLVNKAFSIATGYSAAEAIGQTPGLLRSGVHDASFYKAMWNCIAANGEWHGEIINRRKNGEHYPEWLTISAIRDDAGHVMNYVAVFSDLTTRKQVEHKLQYLAEHDALTGLPNRGLFTDRLVQAIARAERSHSHAAVIALDLDRFQRVNETLGYAGGDQLLRSVALRLSGCLRHTDGAARLGGDAFGIVISDIPAPHDAALIAQKVLDELARPVVVDGNEIALSASLGISVYPDDGRDAETLAKNADSAMYRAFDAGGSAYRYYTHDMNARSSQRLVLESQLRHALERNELRLHYQPLVSASTGRIVGAEALLRWYREDGILGPAAFVPLLEETGLIVPVGEWVLRTACGDSRLWRDAGYDDLICTVNFSAQQFSHPQALELIQSVVRELPMTTHTLELELTESMLMRDPDSSARRLRAIKDHGVRLAIDDFGTGYSSLNYLRRFPIDTLKIDQSFVQDAPADGNACAIIEAIVGISRSLRLSTVAEGVETAEQVAFLAAGGCDAMQGYHFSRPVPPAEFLRLLEAGANDNAAFRDSAAPSKAGATQGTRSR